MISKMNFKKYKTADNLVTPEENRGSHFKLQSKGFQSGGWDPLGFANH